MLLRQQTAGALVLLKGQTCSVVIVLGQVKQLASVDTCDSPPHSISLDSLS